MSVGISGFEVGSDELPAQCAGSTNPTPTADAVLITFNPSNSLPFPVTDRTYLVTLVWDINQGVFTNVFGPLVQKVTPSLIGSAWVREDSRTAAQKITWEVYIPPVDGNYGPVLYSATAVAWGAWSNILSLSPACSWLAPVLVPQ